jgi:hypothetical protein
MEARKWMFSAAHVISLGSSSSSSVVLAVYQDWTASYDATGIFLLFSEIDRTYVV